MRTCAHDNTVLVDLQAFYCGVVKITMFEFERSVVTTRHHNLLDRWKARKLVARNKSWQYIWIVKALRFEGEEGRQSAQIICDHFHDYSPLDWLASNPPRTGGCAR